jgi:hypothetical protein
MKKALRDAAKAVLAAQKALGEVTPDEYIDMMQDLSDEDPERDALDEKVRENYHDLASRNALKGARSAVSAALAALRKN